MSSVIKSIGLALLTAVHAFPENVIVLPEFLYIFFPVHKVQVGVYFVVHCLFLLLSFSLFCFIFLAFFFLKISVTISSAISPIISKISEITSITPPPLLQKRKAIAPSVRQLQLTFFLGTPVCKKALIL